MTRKNEERLMITMADLAGPATVKSSKPSQPKPLRETRALAMEMGDDLSSGAKIRVVGC